MKYTKRVLIFVLLTLLGATAVFAAEEQVTDSVAALSKEDRELVEMLDLIELLELLTAFEDVTALEENQ